MSRKARLAALERRAAVADGDGMPEVEILIEDPFLPLGTRFVAEDWPTPAGPVACFVVGIGPACGCDGDVS